MSMYRIKIEKYEDNPQYDPEKIAENNRWNRDYDPVVSEQKILRKAMEADLTDEEFAAIKKAVLEVM